ncbi:GGDEF domain-containing response regulator [Sulfuriferula nivalis]|uniref:diguanylate cyclase n=1 Tax=Sulfuriferula nivalis TaxID=2675298 RepID=A0A809REJ4_9PROT|nr:diguanylate cyclase [Sulfuriferula nivalis]BBP00199.1 diguanylate cyclase response regulator [Sulfuriferula nivalis]
MSKSNNTHLNTIVSDHIAPEILLIEDQHSLAHMTAAMLYERWDFAVTIATTKQQAQDIIRKKPGVFFLAVSDLNLPDAPHGEIIDVLTAAKLPFIALTGMFNEQMRNDIMSRGAIDYVLKDTINAYEYIVELVGRLHKNTLTKVLVIDDSASVRAMLQEMLRIQFIQVVTAENGREGITKLWQQPDIKLVLVDHEMPVMDGFTFLSTVRRKLSKVQLAVIGISGSENKQLSAQFLKMGANDFIAKPFSYEELACRVRQNLEMQEGIEAVRYIAFHDYLTGLLNRRAFFEQGAVLFNQNIKHANPLAVAVIDIDFFKKINDAYGHDAGDITLKHFAAILVEHFGANLVARIGGEEFAVLIDETTNVEARFEALRLHVASAIVDFNNMQIAYTISIGLTQQSQSGLNAMLKLADTNLYTAKNSGRNQLVAV